MKRLLAVIPGVRWIRNRLAACRRLCEWSTSAAYWESRYKRGGTSGGGSYGRLAEFKAEVLNAFVEKQQIASVIEFGCGDGNQLQYARYPAYVGLDVSRDAIHRCADRFRDDPTKSFFLYVPDCFVDRTRVFCADLAVSLDVLFHLVEDKTFELYLQHFFQSAARYAIIYSSNEDRPQVSLHERHRRFIDYVAEKFPEWLLVDTVKNRYPWSESDRIDTSLADFHIYAKSNGC